MSHKIELSFFCHKIGRNSLSFAFHSAALSCFFTHCTFSTLACVFCTQTVLLFKKEALILSSFVLKHLEQSVIWNALADGGKAVALIEALVVAFDQNVNWNVFAPIVGLLTDYV